MRLLDYLVGGVLRLPYYSTRPVELANTLSRHWRYWREAESAELADCAFVIGGGLGDTIVAARFVRDLVDHFGPITFDIYGDKPAAVTFAFGGIEGVRDCLPHAQQHWSDRQYLAVIDVTDFIQLRSFSPDLAMDARQRELTDKLRTLECAIQAATRPIHNFQNMVANHPQLDNLLAQTAAAMGYKRHNFCYALSGIRYEGHSLGLPRHDDVLRRFGLADRPFITIADGFDRECSAADPALLRSTKSYPHYDALVAKLKRLIPDLYIVQVGKSTGEPIAGIDKVLVDKTSLPELTSVLAASRFHIDNEGGLVHLATSLGTTCCVMFGPTNLRYFGYDENINVEPAVCGNCYWTTNDWMTRCARGDDVAPCLSQTSPSALCELIVPAIERIFRVPQALMS